MMNVATATRLGESKHEYLMGDWEDWYLNRRSRRKRRCVGNGGLGREAAGGGEGRGTADRGWRYMEPQMDTDGKGDALLFSRMAIRERGNGGELLRDGISK
jgi:hypothetical protein